ncbi:MAG: hypothetical protein ACYDHH_11805 [Solirubrobacteraceae bacterium]
MAMTAVGRIGTPTDIADGVDQLGVADDGLAADGDAGAPGRNHLS